MVRELVKWDYELRVPGQIGDVVARGCRSRDGASARAGLSGAAARAAAASLSEPIAPMKPRPQPAPAHPDPRAIATLAEWIAAAERPLIITAALPRRGGRRRSSAWPNAARSRWSRTVPRTVCLPSSHPMHFGFEPGTLLADADLVDRARMPTCRGSRICSIRRAGCRVAHIGEDPILRSLSDAQLPERSRDAGRHRAGAGGAGARGRAAPADGGGAHRRAPRAR